MATIAQGTTSQSTKKSNGTSDSVPMAELPVLINVWVDDLRVHFELGDGRTIAWPIVWSPSLSKATPEQRQQFSHSAYHVFWDDIDEIIGVKNVLYPPRNLTNSSNQEVTGSR
jgi:hypothetical protein